MLNDMETAVAKIGLLAGQALKHCFHKTRGIENSYEVFPSQVIMHSEHGYVAGAWNSH